MNAQSQTLPPTWRQRMPHEMAHPIYVQSPYEELLSNVLPQGTKHWSVEPWYDSGAPEQRSDCMVGLLVHEQQPCVRQLHVAKNYPTRDMPYNYAHRADGELFIRTVSLPYVITAHLITIQDRRITAYITSIYFRTEPMQRISDAIYHTCLLNVSCSRACMQGANNAGHIYNANALATLVEDSIEHLWSGVFNSQYDHSELCASKMSIEQWEEKSLADPMFWKTYPWAKIGAGEPYTTITDHLRLYLPQRTGLWDFHGT